jgi:hypothetical protein
MIKTIEITFPVPVELPLGFEHTLSCLISMVCELYQQNNPERVMWAASHGSRPIMSMGDITGFEAEIYSIDCEEREDLHVRNPFNPRRAAIREALAAAKAGKPY